MVEDFKNGRRDRVMGNQCGGKGDVIYLPHLSDPLGLNQCVYCWKERNWINERPELHQSREPKLTSVPEADLLTVGMEK